MAIESRQFDNEVLVPRHLEVSAGVLEQRLAQAGLPAHEALGNPLEDNLASKFLLELALGHVVPPLGPL